MKAIVQVLYLVSNFRLTYNIDKETLLIKLTTPIFNYEKYITDRFDIETQQELWQRLDLTMFHLFGEKHYDFKKTMMDILYLVCTFDNAYIAVNSYTKSNDLPSYIEVSGNYENDGSLLF